MPRLTALWLLLAFATAGADYHYASHQGSSTYPYTSWETAADSIQKAVDAASPHDTVYIGSGEYHEHVLINTDSLAVIGRGWDSTLVWSANETGRVATIRIVSNTYFTYYFEGLHIEHRANYWALGDCNRVNLHVNACRFSCTQNPSTGAGIGVAEDTVFTIIENCLFDSLYKGFDTIFPSHLLVIRNCLFYRVRSAIYALGPSQAVINNNIIAECGYTPLSGGCGTLTACNNLIYNRPDFGLGGRYNTIVNNTLVFNNYRYSAFNIGGARQTLLNNSVSNIEWVIDPGDTLIYSYNNSWNVPRGDFLYLPNVYDTTGNLHQFPMFVDTFTNEYHLQAFSPLIDAGDPLVLDVDGTRSDIGCYGGPGGCSYVYLDLAPLIPDSLSAYVDSSGIHLTWRNNYEADFNRYQVFRDTVTGFSPSVFNMIGEPNTSYFLDINISPGVSYYYRLTSVDNQRNVSDHSSELVVYQTGITWDGNGNLQPEYSSIEKAYPNPFNQDITIVYSASNLGPQPSEIRLVIYDIQGRIVKTLVDERKPAGTYRVVWDGNNDLGEPVSSGNYITKLYQWGMGAGDFPVKITLVR